MHDGKADFRLVGPGGVHWQVHEVGGGPVFRDPADGCLATVPRAGVDDPEHATGGGRARRSSLGSPTARRGHHAGGGLEAAVELDVVDVPGSEAGQDALALVLVHDPQCAWDPGGAPSVCSVSSATSARSSGMFRPKGAAPAALIGTGRSLTPNLRRWTRMSSGLIKTGDVFPAARY